MLTQGENLAGLAAMHGELMAKAESIDTVKPVVLDMDWIEIAVYGLSEQSNLQKEENV